MSARPRARPRARVRPALEPPPGAPCALCGGLGYFTDTTPDDYQETEPCPRCATRCATCGTFATAARLCDCHDEPEHAADMLRAAARERS
jgi:hypothetical protein